jgi:hypothetical protein
MSAKKIAGFPFQGIPKMIYTDNGDMGPHVWNKIKEK